jgi:hypothetical protein
MARVPRRVATRYLPSEPNALLMQIWIYVAKRELTEREIFKGRPQTPELLALLAKHGPDWIERVGRRALRPDAKGANRLRLVEWLALCRIEEAVAAGSVSPLKRPAKQKSVADLPPTTRYDDDT